MSIIGYLTVSMVLSLLTGDIINRCRGWWNLLWIAMIVGSIVFMIAGASSIAHLGYEVGLEASTRQP